MNDLFISSTGALIFTSAITFLAVAWFNFNPEALSSYFNSYLSSLGSVPYRCAESAMRLSKGSRLKGFGAVGMLAIALGAITGNAVAPVTSVLAISYFVVRPFENTVFSDERGKPSQIKAFVGWTQIVGFNSFMIVFGMFTLQNGQMVTNFIALSVALISPVFIGYEKPTVKEFVTA